MLQVQLGMVGPVVVGAKAGDGCWESCAATWSLRILWVGEGEGLEPREQGSSQDKRYSPVPLGEGGAYVSGCYYISGGLLLGESAAAWSLGVPWVGKDGG